MILLHSGPEATVSTKSYINSLAAHQQLLYALIGTPARLTPRLTPRKSSRPKPGIGGAGLAQAVTAASNPRIAFIGTRDHGATALYAGLITKEAAKIAAEGFIGGEFRHGPLELAGPGLSAILFGAWADDTSGPVTGLAGDLVATGADVTLIGDLMLPGTRTIETPRGTTLTEARRRRRRGAAHRRPDRPRPRHRARCIRLRPESHDDPVTSQSPGPGAAAGTTVTVGIDLGGTGTRLVALDQAGEIRSRVSVPTRHHRAGDVSQLIADLAALIQDAAGGAGWTPSASAPAARSTPAASSAMTPPCPPTATSRSPS